MADYTDDFREVAHSGGVVTFKIATRDGQREYQIRISGRSSHAMAMFGVYALPQGVVLGDIQLGGIDQPWNPPPHPECFPVFVASDSEGKFGHQCPVCEKYWRSSAGSSRWPMTCPYCGIRAATFHFLTKAQHVYIDYYTHTLIDALASEAEAHEVTIDMDTVATQSDLPKPEFYYTGQTQQTRFTCSECATFNDIRGQFGYCSSCGWRNNRQWVEGELGEVRAAMNGETLAPGKALKDAVSVFDSGARNFMLQLAERVPMTRRRQNQVRAMLFHSIDRLEQISSLFDFDLFLGMEDQDRKFLNLMLHRRHAFEHDGGIANAFYLQRSGDSAIREGDLIRENRENVHRLIGLLHKMMSNFDAGFHELLPPEETPIKSEKDRKQRRTRRS